MQVIILLITIISLISIGLKSEKVKKKEEFQGKGGETSPFRNPVQSVNVANYRNYSTNRKNFNRNFSKQEKTILEKAEENTRESKKPVEPVNPVQVEIPKVQYEAAKKEEVVSKEKKIEPKRVVEKEKEEKGYKPYGSTIFDDFGASDALYLAKKDVMTGATWL